MLVPGSVNPLLLTSAAGAAGGGVSRSLRFNSADSAYLSRTPGSAGNRKTWTYSCWVKRAKLGAYTSILSTTGNNTGIRFDPSTNKLELFDYPGSYSWRLLTTQTFRDPSAWFHLVFALDTTQSTSTNRGKLYINGSQITVFDVADYPSLNFEGPINNNTQQAIGDDGAAHDSYFDGYLADVYFIDGQALTPSSFTETDATTGQLIPKAFTGSYGTNGFHLEFSDNSGTTSTTLGKDSAGSNNWTPNNFSVSSGAGNDSLVDVPVNGDQTDTGVGGEVRGNYCVLNPLDKSSVATLSNGNLDVSTSATHGLAVASIMVSSGKYYAEYVATTLNAGNGLVGVCNPLASRTSYLGGTTGGVGYGFGGDKWVDGSNTGGLTSATTGDVIGIALDKDNNEVKFYKNNTLILTQTGLNSSQPYTFAMGHSSNAGTFNFGQRAFAYTAPSGFKALCTANLPAPVVAKPSTVMDVKLYTGNGSTQTISGLGFSPDFVWIKSRSFAESHRLLDTIRTATKTLYSDLTIAEGTDSTGLTAFNSDGFTLGSSTAYNQSSSTYVAWTWDAGTSTVTNTQGSITSSVRANASAGFSIVTYTGNGSSTGATVGHGLGVEPSFFIIKNRSASSDWVGYHKSVGSGFFLILNSTSAAVSSAMWDGAPSSTVLKLNDNSGGTFTETNTNGQNYVAYCFAPVAGYSSFGSYTGNGSSTDGPFVYTGHRSRMIIFKRTDTTNGWVILDAARNTYNYVDSYLEPNTSSAEFSGGASGACDFLSNGFKVRSNGTGLNASGGTYIYAAFAESPFNYARAR